MLDVAQEVLVAPRVVEADDRATDECRAAEREQIVGGVVEKYRDVVRPTRREALEEQRCEPAGFVEEFAVRPRPVRELDRDAIAELLGVAAQQGRGIGRNQRRLPRRGYRSRTQVRHCRRILRSNTFLRHTATILSPLVARTVCGPAASWS